MVTEKQLIDVNSLVETLSVVAKKMAKSDAQQALMGRVLYIIEHKPTVDAVEVVRCKDCLYRSQYSDENGMYHCGGIDTTKDHVLPVVAPDFFCADGERRFP